MSLPMSSTDAKPRSPGELVAQTLDSTVLRDTPLSAQQVETAVAALRTVLVARDLVLLVEKHGLMVNGDEVSSTSAIRLLHRLAAVRIRRVRIESAVRDQDLASMLHAVQGTDADTITSELRARRVTGVSIELRDSPMLPAMAVPEPEPEPEPEIDEIFPVAVAQEPVAPARAALQESHWDVPVDPELEARQQRQETAYAAELFAKLLSAQTNADRQQLFGALVRVESSIPFLEACLTHERAHVVVTALALLRAKNAQDSSLAIAELMRHADSTVRLNTVKALGALATPVCWNALQLGLFDKVLEIRMASLLAFDSREEPLPAAVMRSLLARETVEEMLVQIVERMGRYKAHEVSRALAKAAVLQVKERGSIRILRAMLEQLTVLQPPIARRLAHYLRDSPNPMRGSLGEEIYRRTTVGGARRDSGAAEAPDADETLGDAAAEDVFSEMGLANFA
jgi:hypothetical protein